MIIWRNEKKWRKLDYRELFGFAKTALKKVKHTQYTWYGPAALHPDINYYMSDQFALLGIIYGLLETEPLYKLTSH